MSKRSSVPSNSFPLLGTIFGIVIIFFGGVLIFQNWQPLIPLFFLGQKTIAIPISFLMLMAIALGGLAAFLINLLTLNFQENDSIQAKVQSQKVPPQNKSTDASSSNPYPSSKSVYEEDDDDDDYIYVKYINK
jgi:hypothetical protein